MADSVYVSSIKPMAAKIGVRRKVVGGSDCSMSCAYELPVYNVNLVIAVSYGEFVL